MSVFNFESVFSPEFATQTNGSEKEFDTRVTPPSSVVSTPSELPALGSRGSSESSPVSSTQLGLQSPQGLETPSSISRSQSSSSKLQASSASGNERQPSATTQLD